MSDELPKPETLLTYASILEKPQYWIDPRGRKWLLATGEIIEAACAALRYCAETRIFVLPGGERGVICGGRFDGWLCWLHPDGQFVTLEKLKAEAPCKTRFLFNEPHEG